MRKITKKYSDKNIVELVKASQTLREEIAKLIINQKAAPAKNTNLIKNKKKELAVILTVLTQKQAVENVSKK